MRQGAEWEMAVRSYLEGLGWNILVSNYHAPGGEIDIIAEERIGQEPTLVFVEVKARSRTAHGSPLSAVDSHKQKRIVSTARYYLSENSQGVNEPSCRFDVAEVWIQPDGKARIELRRGIFWEES